MTSSNVSNLLMAAPVKDTGPYLSIKGKNELKDISFEKTLKGASISLNDCSASKSDLMKNAGIGTVEAATSVESSSSTNIKVEIKEKDGSKNQLSDDEIKDVEAKIEKFGSKVKEAISEEMDVSEEDIEKAMETLGLTYIDLADPVNLAQLVLELSESKDSFALIFDNGFNGIFDRVNDLFKQLLDETGISALDMKEIMISLEVESEELISTDVKFSLDNSELDNQMTDASNAGEKMTGEEALVVSENKSEVAYSEQVETEDVTETDENGFLAVDNKSEAKNDKASTGGNNSGTDMGARTETKTEPEGIVFTANERFEINYSQETEMVTLPTGESVQASEIINQLVEKASVFTTSEATTMEMTLNPEGLGKIFMEVTQKGEEITAKIFTENQAVKEVLENQMASLRTQLTNSSNKITSIEVSVGAHEFERNLDQGNGREEQQQEQHEELQRQARRNRIDLNSIDGLSGLMTEEESLVYNMMRDNGNTLDYQA